MPLTTIAVTEEELENNYKHWLSKWDPLKLPSDKVKTLANIVLPTHTFGYIKTIKHTDSFPYKKIFFDAVAGGLLSDGYREENHYFDSEEVRRAMETARAQKLSNYVFAYLGMHEPYYAANTSGALAIASIPFGIFLKKDIETLPFCLPTRRDINKGNEDVDQTQLSREYLSPDRTRTYVAYQVANETAHRGDFWHYYGTPEHWNDRDYSRNSWKKKAEYHYFEKVGIDKIAAVLWPIWYDVLEDDTKSYSESYYELEKARELHPDCTFVPYNLDKTDPEGSFISASYNVIQYYINTLEFPESAEMI